MWKRALVILCFSTFSGGIQASGISKKAPCHELLQDEWLRAVVIQNINQVADFPGNWAIASHHIMFGLIAHFQNPNLDFAFFEQFFRQNDVPLYLVANSEPLGGGLEIGYPPELAKLKRGSAPKYHLWIGVTGEEEARSLKSRLGISEEENLLRLKDTGFILTESLDRARENPKIEAADPKTIDDLRQVELKRPFDPEDN